MIDLGNGPKSRPPPVFSLDKREQARMRNRSMTRGEWRALIILPLLLGTVVWTIYDYRDKIAAALSGAYEPIPPEMRLKPMSRPAFDVLPSLPAAAEIAGERPAAQAQIAASQPPPITASGLDAPTLAWAEERLAADTAMPPVPQRVGSRELVLADHVSIGTPVIIEGGLEDRLPAPVSGSDRVWQRLLISLDEGQFVQVLAGPAAADLVLGHPVRVTGRLLSFEELPAGKVRQTMPVLLARVITERQAEHRDDALAEYHRPFSVPEGLGAEVDDFRLWVETRPYYYALGQALRDRTDPAYGSDAPDGNQAADDVHLKPGEFRNKPFLITGYVYRAWEDEDVARDQPFGVARVVRMLLWRRDMAPVTETVNGVTARKLKLVLRLYELAAVTDQKVPEKGSYITAVGRFLKKRAIAVDIDPVRDRLNEVNRQSDRVYTWMYTCGPWEELDGPRTYQFGPVTWFVTGFGILALSIALVVGWRELKTLRANHRRIRQFKEQQQRLRSARPVPGASPAEDAGQAPPPA